jgi:hypothetical protein
MTVGLADGESVAPRSYPWKLPNRWSPRGCGVNGLEWPRAACAVHGKRHVRDAKIRPGLPCSAMFGIKLAAVGVRTVLMHPGGAVVVGLRTGMTAARHSQCVGGCRHKSHHSNQQKRARQVNVEFHLWFPPDCFPSGPLPSGYNYGMSRAMGLIRKNVRGGRCTLRGSQRGPSTRRRAAAGKSDCACGNTRERYIVETR